MAGNSFEIFERHIFSETTVTVALRTHDQETQLWLQDVASAACEMTEIDLMCIHVFRFAQAS